MNPQRKAGPDIMKEVVRAAMGGKTFKQATREISNKEKDSLGRCLGKDVDLWRQEFAQELRATGSELLAQLRAKQDELKPGEIAYSLAVVVDKASSIEGRNQVLASSVNIQVNNYAGAGGPTKAELLASLSGAVGAPKRVGDNPPPSTAEAAPIEVDAAEPAP